MTGAGASMALEASPPARSLADALINHVLVPVSTMLTIGALALLVLLSPIYLHAAIDYAGAPALLGTTVSQANGYSDRTVGELLFGPATFDFVAPDGSPFFDASERGHMRDVRAVLFAFLAVAAGAAVVLAAIGWRRRGDATLLRAIGQGGALLVIGTIALGAFAAIAFDAAFELFHELLFPGGNFSFDPQTERLVQLYPYAFWQLTAAVMGGLLILGGGAVWLLARYRLGQSAGA